MVVYGLLLPTVKTLSLTLQSLNRPSTEPLNSLKCCRVTAAVMVMICVVLHGTKSVHDGHNSTAETADIEADYEA